MQENIKKASSKEAEEIAERYRRELLSFYRMRKPAAASAPVLDVPKEEEDTRPLFPEDFTGEVIVMPPMPERPNISPNPLPEVPMTRPVPPIARPVPLPEAIRPIPPEENPDIGVRPFEPGSPDGALIEDSMPGEDSEGFLQIQVTTASGAIPIYDAHVTVSRDLGGGKMQFRQAMTTDRSGKSPTIPLPAPMRELSESPGNEHPYSVYNVFVHKDGFYPVENLNVPIFAGVKSIQPVALVPIEEFSENPGRTQIFYGEEPDL